jgi:arylsulfatase A-like enzyme
MTPTLLDACALQSPSSMQGKSLKTLPTGASERKAWVQSAYIQVSGSMVGRAIRTKDWTFCVYDPEGRPDADPVSKNYLDFCMYQTGADPYQKVNLIGRPEYKQQADLLRAELKRHIIANGEPEPLMKPQKYYV